MLRVWEDFFGAGLSDSPTVFNYTTAKDVFLSHYATIRRRVPVQQLLEYEVGKDGWEPLCQFLEVPVPTDAEGGILPFPRGNNKAEMAAKVRAAARKIGMVALWGLVVVWVVLWLIWEKGRAGAFRPEST